MCPSPASASPGLLEELATDRGPVRLVRAAAPADLAGLAMGAGLGSAFRHRPGAVAGMLTRLLGCGGSAAYLALAGEEVVGLLAIHPPDPAERWGEGAVPGLTEMGSLEVDRGWRRLGLGSALLRVAFADPAWEEAIVLAAEYAWHWDLAGTGLAKRQYRQLLLRLLRRAGFAEFLTDEPNVAQDPMNLFVARIGGRASPALYEAFRSLLVRGPAPSAAPGPGSRGGRGREMLDHYFGTGLTSLRQINLLPEEERQALYGRLIPRRLCEAYGIGLPSGYDGLGNRVVTSVCPEDQDLVRVEVRRRPGDEDPLYLLKLTVPAPEFLEIAFVMVNDPDAPRFDVDRDEAGNRFSLLSGRRNPRAEERAMAAGLGPGQVRRGLRLFRHVVPLVEDLASALGKEQLSIEAKHYHHAILYERHGFGYIVGREAMEGIHRGFSPGGHLLPRLDGSTPFRRPGAEATVRGRSWAIHDGILGEPWRIPRMYKIVGQRMALPTWPDFVY